MNDSTKPTTGYPISYEVNPQLNDRNRKTVFFRIILAIPHFLILGGATFAVGERNMGGSLAGSGLGGAATAMAIVAWFAILFWKTHPRGLWDFTHYYMRWSARASAYFALLRDDYPPFGDGDGNYPARFITAEMPADDSRNRWAVFLRLIYVIPHIIVLVFLGIAWVVVTIIAWFAILFTGSYPAGMYGFSVGVLRWLTRVHAYSLLMTDVYPPFSLEA